MKPSTSTFFYSALIASIYVLARHFLFSAGAECLAIALAMDSVFIPLDGVLFQRFPHSHGNSNLAVFRSQLVRHEQ